MEGITTSITKIIESNCPCEQTESAALLKYVTKLDTV
jgi:hypothetical protein